MSKKVAELSAKPVAAKGTALPPADRPARIAPRGAAPAAVPPPGPNGAGQGREALAPLNFRIPASFRREFKTYAAHHDLKLNQLLRLCFEAYRQQQGG